MNPIISEILALLADSRKGYQEASERAEDATVKAHLSELSMSRTQLIDDLARASDEDPVSGSLKGTLHRVWIDIRDALSTTENTNILRECERGETFLAERYKAALEATDIPDSLKTLLEKQWKEVVANLTIILSMRRTLERSEA
jgi:uncharacterized protein (TIGR02284 family)